jgi:hypothetical protein
MFVLLSLDFHIFRSVQTSNLDKTPLFVAAEVILLIYRTAKFEAIEGKPITLLRIKFLHQFMSSRPY